MQKKRDALVDMFANRLGRDRAWWRDMPVDLALQMFSVLLPPERWEFLHMITPPEVEEVMADILESGTFRMVPLVLFVPAAWAVLWVEEARDEEKAHGLLRYFSPELISWGSWKEMQEALYPVVRTVALHWHATSLDNPDTQAAPFFAPYLAEALSRIITPGEFADIKSRLAGEI